MKKVLAIVLSLAMVLSLASAAFAFDPAPGQVYVGPKADIVGDPGEEVALEIELVGLALENDGYSKTGTLVIPFEIFGNSSAPITDLVLTNEAIAAGAELVYDEAMGDIKSPDMYQGSFRIPSSYLYDSRITLAKLVMTIDEQFEWTKPEEGEEAPSIGISFAIGADYYLPLTVEEGDEVMDVVSITSDAIITEKPYQPTFWEKTVETIKSYVAAFIEILCVGLQYVKNNFLQNPDWFTPPEINLPPIPGITA